MLGQQRPHPWLERSERRLHRRFPHVLRWLRRRHSTGHRVARDAQPSRDLRLRHALRGQPPNQRPVLQSDHTPIVECSLFDRQDCSVFSRPGVVNGRWCSDPWPRWSCCRGLVVARVVTSAIASPLPRRCRRHRPRLHAPAIPRGSHGRRHPPAHRARPASQHPRSSPPAPDPRALRERTAVRRACSLTRSGPATAAFT